MGQPGRRPFAADHRRPRPGREATIPFVGFAEAFVLSAFRRAGVPLQRIHSAVEVLSREIGIDHALASQHLYTDGVEVLYDFANERSDADLLELVDVRTGQKQLSEDSSATTCSGPPTATTAGLRRSSCRSTAART